MELLATEPPALDQPNPFQIYRPYALTPEILALIETDIPGIYNLDSVDGGVTKQYFNGLCESGGMRNGSEFDAVCRFRLDSVDAVLHHGHALLMFEHWIRRFNQRKLTGPNTNDFSEEQKNVLKMLTNRYQDLPPGSPPRSARTFYCFYGPRIEHLESICMNGPVAVLPMDGGYFGGGCYATLNMEYAIRFAAGEFDPKEYQRELPPDGRIPIIMFAACSGHVYPVTPSIDYETSGTGHSSSYVTNYACMMLG